MNKLMLGRVCVRVHVCGRGWGGVKKCVCMCVCVCKPVVRGCVLEYLLGFQGKECVRDLDGGGLGCVRAFLRCGGS